jgi:uncharacterized protein (TIGR00255 family)
MNSMTGFGSAVERGRDLDLEVELRSVNHRFFSLKQNLPDGLGRHEAELEEMVRGRCARGSFSLSVAAKTPAGAEPALPDLARFRAVHRRLQKIRRSIGLKGEVELEDLLAVPALWETDAHDAPASLWPRVRKLAGRALDGLAGARAREGKSIERAFRAHLAAIEAHLDRIQERVPLAVAAYQKKLDDRIQAVLAQKGLAAAAPDIVKEVALYADRCDTSEEVQRLRAHVAEFRKILAAKGPVGRRLDFLAQEMLRETNTIASKGSDAGVSAAAVEIKSELEKIKEQVENVE